MTKRIFLAGPSGVGKTTTGKALVDLIGCRFFDLDDEIEDFFGTSIARLQEALGSFYYGAMVRALRDVLARRISSPSPA